MTVSIVALVVIVGLSFWFTIYPFFRKQDDFLDLLQTPSQKQILQRKRSQHMLHLKELDFDYEMGKLSKDDYQALRAQAQAETVETLKQIEKEETAFNEFLQTLQYKT